MNRETFLFSPDTTYALMKVMLQAVKLDFKKPFVGPGDYISFRYCHLRLIVWMDEKRLTCLSVRTINDNPLMSLTYDEDDVLIDLYPHCKRGFMAVPTDKSMVECMLLKIQIAAAANTYIQQFRN